MKNCRHCGKQFVMLRHTKGFCSLGCSGAATQGGMLTSDMIAECTCCHALVGLGGKKSAKLIGSTFTTVLNARKARGVETALPASGSWKATWGAGETYGGVKWASTYQSEWMKDVNAHGKSRVFPAWGDHTEFRAWRDAKRYAEIPAQKKLEMSRANMKCRARRMNDPDELGKMKQRRKEWKASYYIKNPSAKVADTVRARLCGLLRKNESKRAKRSKTEEYVGCSWAELRQYLESQFIRHMSWENHGSVWHVDHITPCTYFDLTKEEEIYRCFHFSNLRPLWRIANIKRGNRVGHSQPQLLLSK